MAPGLSRRPSRTRSRRSTALLLLRPPPPLRPLRELPSELLEQGLSVAQSMLAWLSGLGPWRRAAVMGAAVAVFGGGVVMLVFSHAILAALEPMAAAWRTHPAGWIGLWLAVFAAAFPPLVGYGFLATVCGFVFGFPTGWPVAASAAVCGSLAAFLASRTVFSGYVLGLVGRDPRFVAFAQVLRHDGFLVLTLIRLCPVPFSLANGFLATIPFIRPSAFAVATAVTSPKLLVHVFIGSRLALLVSQGDRMSTKDKAVNMLSMALSAVLGLVVGLVVYRRTMARAAEIVREEATSAPLHASPSATTPALADCDYDFDYAEAGGAGDEGDLEARLVDPDVAAALMFDDDDAADAPSLRGGDRIKSAYRDDAGHGRV